MIETCVVAEGLGRLLDVVDAVRCVVKVVEGMRRRRQKAICPVAIVARHDSR